MEDRLKFLSQLSGLTVDLRVDSKGKCYVFRRGNYDVAAYYTYKKARAFADGVNYARSESNPCREIEL